MTLSNRYRRGKGELKNSSDQGEKKIEGREMSGRSGGGRGGGGRGGGYQNPCLTMHQPWASLLVYGIKRIEGRSWPSPLTGRLWIHAAGKVPDADTIKAMEDFYREIYAVNGITDLKFPEHYPTSRLVGCVDIVGCLKCEELVSWEEVPESVRLEGLTNYCWLCENPQRLVVPFEMRGYQGVYNLEKRVFEAARRGLSPVQGPLPVKFPLPDPQNPLSLRPGSLASCHNISKSSTSERPSTLTVAIAGARAAATQFSKKGPSGNAIEVPENVKRKSEKITSVEEIHLNGYFSDEVKKSTHESRKSHNSSNHLGASNYAVNGKMEMRNQRCTYREVVKDSDHQPRPSSKLFAAALKELGSSHNSS